MEKMLPIQVQPTPWIKSWLEQTTPLTTRLERLTGDAQLSVLKQEILPANWWDIHVLKIQKEQVLLREIMVSSGNDPWWYARTLIPMKTLQADNDFFDRLKHEPLSALIYEELRVTRQITYYPINAETIEYHWLSAWLTHHEPILWARLSTFVFEGRFRFFLVEIFLSKLLMGERVYENKGI